VVQKANRQQTQELLVETVFGISMNTIMVVVLTLSVIALLVIGFFAWRNPLILRLALRNIPRRRAQTVLIVLGLMLATLLITAAFGTGDTMTYSMRQAFTAGLGGTDISIQKVNPIIAIGGPPDFNRPVPTFDRSVLTDIQSKLGPDDRIDGWSAQLQQIGPLIDTDSQQGSGQTFITGVGSDLSQTVGDLQLASGGTFDISKLQQGEILIDQSAADKLNAQIGHNINIIINGKTTSFKVRDIVKISSPSSQYPVSYIPLAQMQQIYNAPNQITEIDISLKGSDQDALQASNDVADKLETVLDTTQYSVNEVKQNNLNTANLIGNLFTTIFLGTALFSIAAGILLIFLIFTMLAAERKSEMGMARAIGTQRGHLTQMFVFEGLAYDLAAAALGAALGVGVGFAMVGVISGIFGTYGFQLVPHVEVRSIVVAYCLGMLVTFFTVAISAIRVSRLNIVAAIRDIPDAPKPEQPLLARLTGAFDLLASGQPGAALGSLISLLIAILFSGPVACTLGILFMALGWIFTLGFVFHLGATLFIIGLGFTIRWILARRGMRLATRNRIAFTLTGLLLVIYWALPVNALHDWFGLPNFGFGIEYFFIAGLAMVAGAVWVVIYNSDLLLGAMTLLLGRVGQMRPVLKTAVAYPMSAIFRTGMAVAMFALIMFVLILMSVLTGLNQQADPNKPNISGGYQIEAAASYSNPIPDINASIASNPSLNGKFDTVTGQSILPLQLRQVDPPSKVPTSTTSPEGWGFYTSRLVDQNFLSTNGFELTSRAVGYNSDREVWEAVAKDPTLVVVDYFPVYIGQFAASGVGAGGGFGGADSQLFTVTGAKTNDKAMKPVTVELQVPGLPAAAQKPAKVKIIGVLTEESSRSYTGVYINRDLASQVVPPQMASLLPVTTYFFRVKPGEDPQALRRALGSAFINNGLEPVVISDKIHQQQAVANGLNGLLQGFMALGLLVGVAALGVISTRAVVERRQQIGVLRAIGYRRGMVGMSFLLESSFIALLGILIGVVLGLILSYNFVQYFAKDSPTLQWAVPWLQIGGIVLLAYIVSLLTTIAPARQAASIYPAEALRYE
jgi:putative ABC transport system permease protein